jgi:hypothetical protein
MERGRVEKVKEDALHLPSGSSFQTLYRTNLRMQALVRLGQTQLDENYSFFALLTTNPQGRQKIQNEFFKFLKVAQQESQKYPSEEVYQMNFDILKWSHDLP